MYNDLADFVVIPHPQHVSPRPTPPFVLRASTPLSVDPASRQIGELLVASLAPATGWQLTVGDQPGSEPSIHLVVDPTLHELGREGYELESSAASVVIRAATPAGIFYGTQTLRQLLPNDIFSSTPVKREWVIPALNIKDSPRFAWRGLMLDVARHFFDAGEIYKLLDLLALHKQNVLHLHLTDDQGWRIEIKRYPRLTEVGAWRKETVIGHARMPQGYDGTPHGGYYTQDELRAIVAYAAERFITVVPEIDLPGHANAAIASYPELGVTGEQIEVGTTWGVLPHLFNPEEATLEVLRQIFAEVLEIFPSTFIHVGGDEAIKTQWQQSPRVQARIKELGLQNEDELQSWFLSQIGAFLTQNGRRMVGWDEILEGGLPEGATVMSWRGEMGGIAAARAGHNVVMTPGHPVYLDNYQTNDPNERLNIHGYNALDAVYAYQPVPAELTPEQAQHVLGSQGNLWTEYIADTAFLEYMLFPRLLALAEVTWTDPQPRDFAAFRRRLSHHEGRLDRLGVAYRSVALWDLEASYPTRKYPWESI